MMREKDYRNLLKQEIDTLMLLIEELIVFSKENGYQIDYNLLLEIINKMENVIRLATQDDLINTEKYNKIFYELVEAMENKDRVLMIDLLEFEIKPIISKLMNF